MTFRLNSEFIDTYKQVKPKFGFNGLGEFVYQRTYSRIKDDGTKEQWYETVERVVNGTYTMQKQWIQQHKLGWKPQMAQDSAQEMYDHIFNMKFLPPGRGLWAMGTAITEERKLYAALNNCAFVSTDELSENATQPFCFLMDALMLGVGVGFDTSGTDTIVIKGVNEELKEEIYEVPDTREGWVESLRKLLESYFEYKNVMKFDYSKVRAKGLPIRGFGGTSSGPQPLIDLHEKVREILNKNTNNPITTRSIVDIMNLIGTCVIAGNVRRSAEISFGDPNSDEFLDLKDYNKNPDRAMYGWSSNNSVFAEVGMNYEKICSRIALNGEPGVAWLKNMQNYGRMNEILDNRDHRAKGGNPCLEQTLESYELCCLVETFPANHDSLEDYVRTLKFAYLYAKTVTLGKTHWPETNRVLLRNRRIGCSMSGIAQFVTKNGMSELKKYMEVGYEAIQNYDKIYSDWLAIPRSIKTTSIKPSGTVSLLAGATPGIHYPESRYYIRRVRLSKDSELLKPLVNAGYYVEEAKSSENTMVVEFPVDVGAGIRTVNDLTIWEQLSIAAFAQKYWADNQVSCTVTFKPESEGHQIKHALDIFQYQLKGISFLPKLDYGCYEQMPYEQINESKYKELLQNVSELSFKDIHLEDDVIPDIQIEKFCDGESCEIKLLPTKYKVMK